VETKEHSIYDTVLFVHDGHQFDRLLVIGCAVSVFWGGTIRPISEPVSSTVLLVCTLCLPCLPLAH
jgi:hypothetical protein